MIEVLYKDIPYEEFESMREADEYIDYKVTHWPDKYDYNDFDIRKV